MNATALLREDLRDFTGYRSAAVEAVGGELHLNANEAATRNHSDAGGELRRYPPPQPAVLCEALARLYGCGPEQLLVGRGSDEAIDLLVRAACTPGRDAVVVTPPTFGMYAVCARLHGAQVIAVPMRDEGACWTLDVDALVTTTIGTGAKLVFLCSPGNPSGVAIPRQALLAVLQGLRRHALVVVDEAYTEFSASPSAVELIDAYPELAVLRTLSKAHALAGLRLGCVIAQAGLIEALRRCQAPYPLPAPCVQLALQALQPAALEATSAAVQASIAERDRLRDELLSMPGVRCAYPSSANFLLVRFGDAKAVYDRLFAAGIVVRDLRGAPGLGDALRIGIGTRAQNDRLLAALRVQSA